jgi:hypothetical protein
MAGGTEITTAARKQAMLEALTLSFGVIAHAAKQVGIDRTTHYTWLDDDPGYKAAVADLKEYKKDFIESKLIKLINDGDTAATIFAAKTQLKDRGYVERSEITGADGKDLNYTVTLDIGGTNNNITTIQESESRPGNQESLPGI